MSIAGIFENLFADFIFVILGVVLGYIALVCTRRRRLLKFFGVYDSRRLVIYLSNLRVIPFGAIGIDGRQRSFQGSAAALAEMEVANRFRILFNYFLPSLAESPGLLSKLLISDVQIQISLSPVTPESLERSSSFVTLGSPAYNAASGFLESKLHSHTKFVPQVRDEQQILVMSVKNVPLIDDPACGFVERVIDHDQNRCVFYTAGLSALGTAGAAYFLATEWDRLQKKYGNDTPFVVMLRFENLDYRRWSVMFEK